MASDSMWKSKLTKSNSTEMIPWSNGDSAQMTAEARSMLARLNLCASPNVFGTVKAGNSSTPKSFNNRHAVKNREGSSSDPLCCVFCFDSSDELRQLPCLHSVCDMCLEGSPKDENSQCPICGSESPSINMSTLYDISAEMTSASQHNVSNHVSNVLSVLNDHETPKLPKTKKQAWSAVVGRGATVISSQQVIRSSEVNSVGGQSGSSPSGSGGGNASSVSNSSSTCTSCDEGVPAFAVCQDCNEIMCTTCTSAHQRLKVTKEHHLTIVVKSPSEPSATSSPEERVKEKTGGATSQSGGLRGGRDIREQCHVHRMPFTEVCRNCTQRCCEHCRASAEHRGHNIVKVSQVMVELNRSRLAVMGVKPHIESALQMTRAASIHFEENVRTVEMEVETYFKQIGAILQDKAAFLLKQVSQVRSMTNEEIMRRQECLQSLLDKCESVACDSDAMLMKLQEADVSRFINSCLTVAQNAESVLMTSEMSLSVPAKRDIVGFYIAPKFVEALHTYGSIESATCASKSVVGGPHLNKTVVGKLSHIWVQAYDYFGKKRLEGGDTVKCYLVSVENKKHRLATEVIERANGQYAVSYQVNCDGSFHIHVMINGIEHVNSPFLLSVVQGRNYRDIDGNRPYLIVGGEGSEDGKLCRPWGICCDRLGNIYVADRSNNRIQVFDSEGKFTFKFGREGKDVGEFSRPSSVVVDDILGRIIVADKDNHRIQMFDMKGNYQMHIGGPDKSGARGFFTYPWDVAVNNKSNILVSDTRNHRLQLFSAEGIFMQEYKCKDKVTNWQDYFDSPRGVCFGPEGHILVTDFNRHRVVFLCPDFTAAHYFGVEGSEPGCLKRPQGICVDQEGNVLVADSRNHRIQIFSHNGQALLAFGSHGSEEGQLDRPSGICLSPKGRILVIDFGNHRIVGY